MPARERNSCRSSVMATVHMEAVDLDVEFPTGIEQRVEEVLAGRAVARQQVRALRTIGRAHVVTDDIGRQVGDRATESGAAGSHRVGKIDSTHLGKNVMSRR